MKQSDLNHLRRLLGWIRCDIGQSPAELQQTMIDVADGLGHPEISQDARARMVEAYRRAESIPLYVRAAVKALEKALSKLRTEGMQADAAAADTTLPDVLPELTTDGGAQYVSMATMQAVLRAARAMLHAPIAGEEQKPVAEVVSRYGDPEAFGERDLKVLVDLNSYPYGAKFYAAPQAGEAVRANEREPSPTAGMSLGERIAHVGGRTNAQGYIEFGSPMAVNALIQHVLRDLPARHEAAGNAKAWLDLFWSVAKELNCLPSSFVDGNEHVLRAARQARAALAAKKPEGEAC